MESPKKKTKTKEQNECLKIKLKETFLKTK